MGLTASTNGPQREAQAVHLKLDQLLRAMEGARAGMVNLEHMTDAELKELQAEFDTICGPRLEQIAELEEDVDAELEQRHGHSRKISVARTNGRAPRS